MCAAGGADWEQLSVRPDRYKPARMKILIEIIIEIEKVIVIKIMIAVIEIVIIVIEIVIAVREIVTIVAILDLMAVRPDRTVQSF